MDQAFIEHAQNDINRDQRRDDQQWLALRRVFESRSRSLEASMEAGRNSQFTLSALHYSSGIAQRHARRKIERDGHSRKEALVVYLQRGISRLVMSKGRERN